MDNLIREAKQGNAESFTELIQAQTQSMYKASRAILRNDEDIADAISETILTCWEKIGQLKQDKYFKTWLMRILINKCNDIFRERENLFFTDEMPEISITDNNLINVEWREALNSLNERYRIVIMLYYVEGFKTSEISQILEMPESTVRTRMARGREQLGNILGEKRRETV
jgi:RNA polymerase sigma factor, sigma-70 family